MQLRFTLFCLTISISLNVDPLAAEAAADPEPNRSRSYPWPPTAVIEQPNFPPSISGRTPYRPYFYDSSAREMDEEYYNDQVISYIFVYIFKTLSINNVYYYNIVVHNDD